MITTTPLLEKRKNYQLEATLKVDVESEDSKTHDGLSGEFGHMLLAAVEQINAVSVVSP
jgi:hypothetical protein